VKKNGSDCNTVGPHDPTNPTILLDNPTDSPEALS